MIRLGVNIDHVATVRNARGEIYPEPYKAARIAKNCGADFIKFQTSIPELHISKFAEKAHYQNKNTLKKETQLEMAKKITLTYEQLTVLQKNN